MTTFSAVMRNGAAASGYIILRESLLHLPKVGFATDRLAPRAMAASAGGMFIGSVLLTSAEVMVRRALGTAASQKPAAWPTIGPGMRWIRESDQQFAKPHSLRQRQAAELSHAKALVAFKWFVGRPALEAVIGAAVLNCCGFATGGLDIPLAIGSSMGAYPFTSALTFTVHAALFDECYQRYEPQGL